MNSHGVRPGDLFRQDGDFEYYHWVLCVDELGAMCQGGSRDPRQNFKRPLAMMAFGPWPIKYLLRLKRVDHVPLNECELKAYRPDLPLRLLRNPEINWAAFSGRSFDDVKVIAATVDLENEPKLDAPEIVLSLIPSGRGWRKATKFTALNEKCFTPEELLWRCGQVFEIEGVEADNGIGLFRSGINRKVPFFTLGGYHDSAGVTHRHECPEVSFVHFPKGWQPRRKAPSGDFETRLKSFKKTLPFKDWAKKRESGMEQYTAKNFAAVQRVFTQLVDELCRAGDVASSGSKLALFDGAMQKLNGLNAREPTLIESEERDQLCETLTALASLVGLEVGSSPDGENRLTALRDW